MNTYKKWLSVLLLLVGLILLNFIGRSLPGQLDLTGEKLYTLSPGTKAMLAKIAEPIELTFYFSRSVEDVPIFFKNYATRVEDLLRQYEQASGGMISLRVVDPKPDTEEEEAAIRAGLSQQPISNTENVFFGLQAILADQEEAIPLFTLDRQRYLEYDISQLLYQVQIFEKPILGVITSLPVFGEPSANPFDPRTPPSPDWVVIEQLENFFEIEMVSGDSIRPSTEALLILHPQGLDDPTLFAIDQFILSGRPTFVAVDPSSVFQKRNTPQQQMMMGTAPETFSTLPLLLDAWGVRFNSAEVVADEVNAYVGMDQRTRREVRFPVWLTLSEFNYDLPVSAQLNSMILPEAGAFDVTPSEGLEWIPLLRTSDRSDALLAQTLRFSTPDSLARQIVPDGVVRSLAGMLAGTFTTAFPEGKPVPAETEGESAESGDTPSTPETEEDDPFLTSGEGRVILVGDSDFLIDQFSVQVFQFGGMRGYQPLNDNLAFVLNAMDFLAGSPDLLAVRTKGSAIRTFEVVEEMQLVAQERYEEQLVERETRLQEVQSRLRELSEQTSAAGQFVAGPEIQAAIDEFRLEEAAIRSELREIRKSLREDVERLDLTLAVLNISIMPLLLALAGVLYFQWRKQIGRS